ncbi:MAG: hypothetical protein HYW57_07225 [Ignavibacteriales bacterium]|nr:hypothetical protein [Ignavibacteriales bacterium]
MQRVRLLCLCIPALLLTHEPVFSQTHHSGVKALGTVDFPISTDKPSTQQEFNKAMALLHSFWYYEAVKEFHQLTIRDPQCTMAYWGVAMSYFRLLWEPPSDEEIQKARNALKAARHVGAKTEREQMYLDAIQAYYESADKDGHRAGLLAYERAMEQLSEAFPEDQEAAILYALALNATSLKTDKTYANNKKAGNILLSIFKRQPNHPGVAHYIIHSFDSAPLASEALPAARIYAAIAPSVPHALHMPSHIFIRLGLYEENIETNIVSARVASEEVRKTNPGATSFDALHAYDYIVYGYLQIGQHRRAKEVIDRIPSMIGFDKPNLAAAYALAAMPARYILESSRWAEGIALKPLPVSFPWERYPWTEALIVFTRSVSAARSGNSALARSEVERLQALRKATEEKNDPYWVSQIDILRMSAEAWALFREGKQEEAEKMMRSSADLDDATDKHPVTPGSLIPAREMLGSLLLAMNQPAQALKEFEASLVTSSKRLNGLVGAAQAAEQSGDHEKAQAYCMNIVAQCKEGDRALPQVEYARAALTKK